MYVIFGASGYLGSYLIKAVLEKTTEQVLALSRHILTQEENDRVTWLPCDITDYDDVLKITQKLSKVPNIKVIFLTAYHHPDEVKKNPQLAWDVNITSLSRVLNTLENVTCFFYASTEMVYGIGKRDEKFSENFSLVPINVYGKQKMVAESMVLGYGYNVVRYPFLIGTSLCKEKKHFYDIIVSTIENGKTIEMFEDSYKTPMSFNDAAKILIELMENFTSDMPKIINIASDDVLSKYDIGIRIAQKVGVSEALIKPISVKTDISIFTEKRADTTLLDNTLLKRILGVGSIPFNI